MSEMEMYFMKEITDFKVKMAKVETLLEENAKNNKREMEQILTIIKSQQERDNSTTEMLLDLKSEVGRFLGRTDKGDVNVNVDSKTNVDGANSVSNETNIS